MDAVGDRFEKKTLFLPQLLMSAEAAKAAFEVIKGQLQGQEDTGRSRLAIVIATVKGDVHDIGKNIVKVLLENYGFRVFDLGKDVPPELVLEAVQRSMPSWWALAPDDDYCGEYEGDHRAAPKGSAPGKNHGGRRSAYAGVRDSIGADFYGKDAMASVRYATELAESLL